MNLHFKDIYTGILFIIAVYKVLEKMIDNEESKKEKIALAHEDFKKLINKSPINQVLLGNDDYS
jgi:hypothetical protein